uniref:Uncharacterized protein n=1 Tax=Acrobeloides nanus TaxID=290746 RepID=A0A914DVZ6_9BILA
MHLVLFNEKHHIIEHFIVTHCIKPGDRQKFEWKDRVQPKHLHQIKSYSIHYTHDGKDFGTKKESFIEELYEKSSPTHLQRRNAVIPIDEKSNKTIKFKVFKKINELFRNRSMKM